MNKVNHLILTIVAIILLGSCSVEHKLAEQFIKDKKPGAIMLIAPDFVYKSSFKIPDIENFNALSQNVIDSIAYFNSDIIQFCEDSVYIGHFIAGLEKGFEYLKIPVYEDNDASDFLDNGEQAYIFNIAQIQLEEFYDSISDQTSYDSASSNPNAIYITAINLNNWIKITKLNHEKSDYNMLYSSQMIYDDFKGYFVYYPLADEFEYNYSIDSLSVEKLYSSAFTLGFRHAQWLFDYLLNDYIAKNLPAGTSTKKRYTYNYEYRLLKKLKWDPFTEITETE
jgi:hypothetical protein